MPDVSGTDLILWPLAAFFLFGAVLNILQPKKIKGDYERWGYPKWFPWITGLLELATAIMLVTPEWRISGIILGAAIMISATLTLLKNNENGHAVAPALTLVFLLTGLGFALGG